MSKATVSLRQLNDLADTLGFGISDMRRSDQGIWILDSSGRQITRRECPQEIYAYLSHKSKRYAFMVDN